MLHFLLILIIHKQSMRHTFETSKRSPEHMNCTCRRIAYFNCEVKTNFGAWHTFCVHEIKLLPLMSFVSGCRLHHTCVSNILVALYDGRLHEASRYMKVINLSSAKFYVQTNQWVMFKLERIHLDSCWLLDAIDVRRKAFKHHKVIKRFLKTLLSSIQWASSESNVKRSTTTKWIN